jgi:hypothetical protein
MDAKVKDLNLLLLYLTGWEEDSRNNPGEKVFRAWKGYLFEILNELEQDKLVRQFNNAKSLILTDAGKQAAEKLKKQYLP